MIEVRVRPAGLGRLLVRVVGTLVLLHVVWLVAKFALGHGRLHGIGPLLNLGTEHSIGTWYATAQLLACSVLLASIGSATRRADGGSLPWFGLAALFAFLSADEHLQFHESVGALVKSVTPTSGPFAIAWVVPYAIAFLVLGAAYLRFLLRLPKVTRNRFVLAAALFVGGALGLEMVASAYVDATGLHWSQWDDDLTFNLLASVEETLELTGIAVFLHALVAHLECDQRVLRRPAREHVASNDTTARPAPARTPRG